MAPLPATLLTVLARAVGPRAGKQCGGKGEAMCVAGRPACAVAGEKEKAWGGKREENV